MKVSVIVPIYNVAEYLRTCIESVINQTYRDLEILLVDDGSTDDSLAIAKSYEKVDPRIKVFTKANGGLSDARNYGIKHASGDFYFFLDSDDYLELDTFDLMCARQVQTDADIVVCDMVYDYPNHCDFSSGGDFHICNPQNDLSYIFINNSACNKLIRKELFKKCLFPRGLWYEDLATIPIIISKAKVMAKVNKVLYHYLQRADSITKTSDIKVLDIYLALDRVKYEVPLEFDENLKRQYLMNAFYLTILRIKRFKEDKFFYYSENLRALNERYPDWQSSEIVKSLDVKKKILFFLAGKKNFLLMDRLLK